MWGPVGVHLSSKEQKKKMLLPAPVILTTRAWCQRHIALPPARRSTCARHRPVTAAAAQTGQESRTGTAVALLGFTCMFLIIGHAHPCCKSQKLLGPNGGQRSIARLPPPATSSRLPLLRRTGPSAGDFLPPAPAPSHGSLRMLWNDCVRRTVCHNEATNHPILELPPFPPHRRGHTARQRPSPRHIAVGRPRSSRWLRSSCRPKPPQLAAPQAPFPRP